MDMLPAAVGMQVAMVQQTAALSMVKQAADMQQQIADILMASVSGRGGFVDMSA